MYFVKGGHALQSAQVHEFIRIQDRNRSHILGREILYNCVFVYVVVKYDHFESTWMLMYEDQFRRLVPTSVQGRNISQHDGPVEFQIAVT